MSKCPKCGYCEHCGRSNQPYVWPQPYVHPYTYPYTRPLYGTYSAGQYTTVGGNTITVSNKTNGK